jgi:glucose/arabinose dehydrogenase
MNRYLLILFLPVLIINCKSKESAPERDEASRMASADATFKKFCSTCHGDNGDVFVDRRWKHGATRDSIIMNINQGFPALGMPMWDSILDDQETTDLADYIMNAIEKRKQFDFKDSVRSSVFTHQSENVKLDTLAKGLENPWGIAFLSDGEFLYSDRNGNLYHNSKGVQTMVQGAPPVLAEGQGGLLDIELHPGFGSNKLIYLSYSKFKDSSGEVWSTTAVLRAKWTGNKLTEQKDIFVAMPYKKTQHHYGCRMEFDTTGLMFITVGDRGQHADSLPQKLDNDLGKVHRIRDDGSIPADNPFVNTPGARKSIWSYGHRNPQGMALHRETNTIWTHEHGPRGGDELNVPERGKNYGWPVISYGINYDGTILTPLTQKDGMEQPLTRWVPSIGPSGMTFVTGDKYPGWKGDILMGSLRFRYVNRVHLNGRSVDAQENLLKNIGRVRFVEMGPDGFVYVGVEEPGYIFKLIPMAK